MLYFSSHSNSTVFSNSINSKLIRTNKQPYYISYTTQKHTDNFFKQELKSSKNFQNFKAKTQSIINQLGISDYTFLRLNIIKSITGQKRVLPKVILSSHQDEDFNHDKTLSQESTPPISNRHLSAFYHFVSSSHPDTFQSEKHKIHFILITSTGHYNYCLTLNGINNHPYYISFSEKKSISNNLSINSTMATKLYYLTNAISDIGTKKFPDLFINSVDLKKVMIPLQPLRILNIIALQDMTLNEAADQLNLTIDTVNKHMATAKLALGTSTIAGTIWQAIISGLIDTNPLPLYKKEST